MKTTPMVQTLLILVLSLMLSAVSFADGHKGKKMEDRLDKLEDELSLTDEQSKKIKKYFQRVKVT